MSTKAESVVSIEPEETWAEERETQIVVHRLPTNQTFQKIAAAITVVALGGTIWAYVSGLLALHALAGKASVDGNTTQSVAQIVEAANRWALQMAFASVAGAAALFAVAILGARKVRSIWMKLHVKASGEADIRSQRLLGQLADARVSEEESRMGRAESDIKLMQMTQRCNVLEREVEQRRKVEKTFSQQTSHFERSKDAMELHIQARTQELQKLQRRNELILNSAADGIFGFDLQSRATFINPAAAKALGWKIEEIAGKTEDAIFFPSILRGVKEGAGWLKDERGELLPEQTFYRKDGSSFSAEYARTPITENGKMVGSVVTFKDITERRLAEENLNRKATELARSNRELEQFAFVASHDLQEPLRKIQAFGDRLKTKCDEVKLDEGRDYLERMQSAAARMQVLINDLLAFSRVITSSQPLVPVDLGAVTAEVLVDLEHRIEKTSAKVTIGKLPTIQADPTQMRQLIQNLVGNALKFHAPNAAPVVKIDAQIVSREQLREDAVLPNVINAKPDDKFCVLTVEDNGIGFDEQYLDKMFAVFQRLHGRSEYEGTGVGLAVCRRITERHGGMITGQSKPGEGAVFIAILPLEQPEIQEPK